MAIGLGMVGLYLVLHSALLRTRPNYLLGWLAFIGVSEGFNLLNLASPFDLRSGVFRVICYVFLLAGMAMGLRQNAGGGGQLGWPSRVPMMLAWGFVAGAVFFYWSNVSATLAFTSSSRFTGQDLHPVGIAFGFGTCMAVALALLMFDRSPWARLVNAVVLLVLARGLLLTGSRGALLSFVCVAVILAICKNRYLTITHRVWFLIAIGLVCALVAVWLTAGGFAVEQMNFYLRRLESLSTGDDMAANARLVTWQMYAEQFRSWALLGLRPYTGDYPHNFFYEWWLRFGLLGLGASLLALWAVFRSVVLMWRRSLPPLSYAMIGVLLFGFINAQFNLALEFNRAFWLGIGFAAVTLFGVRFTHPLPGLTRGPKRSDRIAARHR